MSWTLRAGHTFQYDSFGSANVSSVTKAYGGAVSSGDLLVALLVVGDSTKTSTSVSDSVNGAWTKGTVLSTTGTSSRLELWYFANSASGTPSVTGGWSANQPFSGIFISAWGGGATASVTDGSGGTGDPNSSAASLSVSLTTAVAGDLVIMGGNCFNGGSTLTAHAPSTLIDTDGSGDAFWLYQTPAGTGSISTQLDLSPNDKAAGVAMAFKLAGGSSPTVTPTGFGLTASLGTPTLAISAIQVSPTGFGLTASLGTPTINTGANPTVTPTGFGLTASLGTFTIQADTALTGITGFGLTASLGSPTVSTAANITVTPTGFALTTGLGTPTVSIPAVSASVSPSGLVMFAFLGTPSLAGAVSASAPAEWHIYDRRTGGKRLLS